MKLIIFICIALIFVNVPTLVSACGLGLCGGGSKKAEAQETAILGQNTFEETVYQCTKCGYETNKKGKCPECKLDLKKVKISRTYLCSSCGYTQKKPGDCQKCKSTLKKATVSYECETCKTSSNTQGDCEHCKTPLKIKVK